MPNNYTAVTVTILHPSGEKETHILSLGGGDATPAMENTRNLLEAYASGALNTIVDIREAQGFLVCAGYGLSNIILLDVSPLQDYFL